MVRTASHFVCIFIFSLSPFPHAAFVFFALLCSHLLSGSFSIHMSAFLAFVSQRFLFRDPSLPIGILLSPNWWTHRVLVLCHPAILTPLFLLSMSVPLCDLCGFPARSKCGACHTTRYCSKYCQKADWRAGHSKACPSRNPNPNADILANQEAGRLQCLFPELSIEMEEEPESAVKGEEEQDLSKAKGMRLCCRVLFLCEYHQYGSIHWSIQRRNAIEQTYTLNGVSDVPSMTAEQRVCLDAPCMFHVCVSVCVCLCVCTRVSVCSLLIHMCACLASELEQAYLKEKSDHQGEEGTMHSEPVFRWLCSCFLACTRPLPRSLVHSRSLCFSLSFSAR